MPLINSQKYKINIDHNSNKIQGLKPGDIVRRQYTDGKNTVYTLMCVIANGIDKITDDKGVLHDSPYFIGALLEGDAPENGQLLDFARITNLYDTERSGALYLTATDSGAPYMSVIDSEPGEKSIAYPTYLAPYNNTVLKDAYCINRRTNTELVAEFTESLEDRKRVITIKREENIYNTGDEELFVSFKDEFPLSQTILVSYRASTKSQEVALNFQFGYPDKSSYDAKGTVMISTEPQYFLHVIQVDTAIRNTKSFFLRVNDIEPGNDLMISDFSIVSLASVSSLENNDKTRIGKITGIVDPVFGQLYGYGTYTENFYATGNTSISGTLTAGDENGFASTFYVGKIKKNILYNSLEPTVTNTSKNEDIAYYPPAKVGSSYLMPSSTQPHIYNVIDEDFYYANNGKKFTFSAWFYGTSDDCSVVVAHGDTSKRIALSTGWVRVSLSFLLQGLEIEMTSTGNVYFASPQLERGSRVTQYQPTDGVLSDNEEEYGAWLCKGGIGGTIQNPLLKFGEDGSIRSKNDSFVINNDGTGHFAEGRFAWTKDKITLKEVTINWESLDDETKDKLTSKSVQVFGDNIFHYSGSDSSSTPDKTSITITTSDNNFVPSSRKWEYMDSDGQWVEISGNGSTLTLTHNNSIWGGRDSIVIKYTASFDGKDYFDTITVYKVYSGETTCVITASLTSCVVSADYEGEIHANKTYTSIISAQKKNISVPVTIGSLPSVKGISLSKSGSSSLLITFRQGKDLDDYGYFNVPVTADGTTYSVTISYMKVKDGAPGDNPNILDWVSDWDNNKTTINGERIVTPKIFAGTVHTNGSLTGLAFGNIPLKVKNPTTGALESKEVTGLYGFKSGECTWFFDARGNAQLGNGTNYIKYDSSTGKVVFGKDVVLTWSNEISNALNEAKDYSDTKLVESKTYTDNNINSINESIGSINGDITNLENYVDGAFRDGIVSDAELANIKGYVNTINTTKLNFDKVYDELYANTYIETSNKEALKNAKDNFNTRTTQLLSKINQIAQAGVVTDEDKILVDTLFDDFNDSCASLSTAIEKANKIIQDALKGYSDAVNDRLDTWADDGVVSPTEKLMVKQEIAAVESEYGNIISKAGLLGITVDNSSDMNNYVTYYEKYHSNLTEMSSNETETVKIPSLFSLWRSIYYTTKQTMLDLITEKEREYISDTAANEAQKKLDEWAEDGVISPVEKNAIKLEITSLESEYNKIVLDAKKYSVAYNNYTTAYTNYKNDLTQCISTATDIVTIPSTLETRQTTYYTEKNKLLQAILNKIDDYNKDIATDAATDVINNSSAGSRNYIRNSSFKETLTGVFTNGVTATIDSSVTYLSKKTLKIVTNGATNSTVTSKYFYFLAINSHICKPAYFSMYVKGNVSANVKVKIGGSSSVVQTQNISTSWKKIEVRVISPSNSYVYIGFTSAGTYHVCMPMLSESSMAVDWKPAEEDLESQISAAEQAGENAQKAADDINKMIADGSWKAKLDTLEYDNNTEIGSNYVFTGLLAAETVAAINIEASQITAGTISTDRLNVSDIATKTVTAEKINSLSLTTTKGKIGNWTIDGNYIYTGTKKTSGDFTDNGITLYGSGNGAIRAKNFRIDTDGSAYFKGNIEATSGKIAGWSISGNCIYTGTAQTSNGYSTSGITIYSSNNLSAIRAQYFRIETDGKAYFKGGSIGGWKIDSDSIYTGTKQSNNSFTASGITIYSNGTSAAIRSEQFRIDTDGSAYFSGKLSAATGSFSGEITATSGKIGGWTINSSNITNGNMSLSSSSISRNNYWALNNDGSGYLAKKNISWNTSGDATFKGTFIVSGDGGHIFFGNLDDLDGINGGGNIPFIGFSSEASVPTNPSFGDYEYDGAYMLYSNGYLLIASQVMNIAAPDLTVGRMVYENGKTKFTGPVEFTGEVTGITGIGEQGPAGEITGVTASVSNTVGTPSCTVTLGGTPSKRTIKLAFKNLKGATGATGPKGATGATGPQGPQGPRGYTGATGPQGPAGTLSASSTCYLPSSGTVFRNGSNNIGIRFSGGNGIRGWRDTGDNIGNLFINNGATSGYRVEITNLDSVTGSDIRLKTIFNDVPNVLDKIKNISAFYHTRKDDEDKIMRIGVSAQAVREVFPELVRLITPENGDSYYAVNYIDLAATVAINGCKELHELIKGHQDVIMALEDKNRVLEEKVVTLEDRIARLEGLLAAKC